MSFITLTDALDSKPSYIRAASIVAICELSPTETCVIVGAVNDGTSMFTVKETPERVRQIVIEAESVARGRDPW